MNKNDPLYNFSGPLKPEKGLGGVDHLRIIVEQLSVPAACVILGVHRTTLGRWLNGSRKVPRHVVLALYWHTSWGRGLIDSDHMRALNILYNEISFLKSERRRLETALMEYEKYGAFDSANAPVYKID
jgi:hypothetical protein